ncbi:MAG: hypothetical protein ABWY20_11420 [Mycobacterium sp.]
MADQQDRPDEMPDAAPSAAQPGPSGAGADPAPPAEESSEKKAPAKAAKKAPAKAAKKAPAKAAKKAAPAKKAAAKKVAKKAPAKPKPTAAPQLADTNGAGQLSSAAKETAAHAKSTVAAAANPVTGPAPVSLPGPELSRLPLVAAIAAGVLAILLILVARRRSDDV